MQYIEVLELSDCRDLFIQVLYQKSSSSEDPEKDNNKKRMRQQFNVPINLLTNIKLKEKNLGDSI